MLGYGPFSSRAVGSRLYTYRIAMIGKWQKEGLEKRAVYKTRLGCTSVHTTKVDRDSIRKAIELYKRSGDVLDFSHGNLCQLMQVLEHNGHAYRRASALSSDIARYRDKIRTMHDHFKGPPAAR